MREKGCMFVYYDVILLQSLVNNFAVFESSVLPIYILLCKIKKFRTKRGQTMAESLSHFPLCHHTLGVSPWDPHTMGREPLL